MAIDDEDNVFARNVIHMDCTASGRQRALQRRAEEAKAKRIEAQEILLGAALDAARYVSQVAMGAVEPEPERLKACLKLADKILPNLSAVQVGAAQVAGVDPEAKTNNLGYQYLNLLASISSDLSVQEQEDRQRALMNPRPNERAGDAIEGSVVDPD